MVSKTVEAIKIACDLAKRFEGFRAKPYLCPANVPTIGYGSTKYLDGSPVSLSDPAISEEEAYKLLSEVMKSCLADALRLCKNLSRHTAKRQAAIADFIYNFGVGNFEKSTLRQMILNEKWDDVPIQLRRWVYAGGMVLDGLKKRREAEIDLIIS